MRFITKTLIFVLIFSAGYYLFTVFANKNKEAAARDFLSLVQNRIAYVELIKLNPQDPNARSQKDELLAKLADTQKEGRKSDSSKIIQIYERQAKLIEKLKGSKTFEEGVSLLKGQESVELLTDQTNLILEYEFLLKRNSRIKK